MAHCNAFLQLSIARALILKRLRIVGCRAQKYIICVFFEVSVGHEYSVGVVEYRSKAKGRLFMSC